MVTLLMKMHKIAKLVQKIKNAPAYFFITTSLVFGGVFILITPPFQAPDEASHFLRAYQISEFNFSVDTIGGVTGGELPVDVKQTVLITTTNPSMEFKSNIKYDVGKTRAALMTNEDDSKRVVMGFASTAVNSPVSYVPQVIGMTPGRLLNLPPILQLYSGRIMNLIAWTSCVALAIKLIPRKKWAMVAIGLLPMALFQAASLSTDVAATGLSAIFITYILHLLHKKKQLKVKQLILLLCVAILLVLSKQVMFVLLGLLFLLPNELFASRVKAYAWRLGIIFTALLAFGLWLYIIRDIDPAATFANQQDQSAQLKFMLLNPFSYINTLWNTYFFTWGDEITRSFIGNFGWVDAPLSTFWVVFGYIELTILLLMSYKAKEWLTKNQKALVICVFVLFWLAVSTVLYLFYNPVGYKIIVGLQGRYFIPLAILLVPLFYNKAFRLEESKYLITARVFPVILLTASVITVGFRYYINNV